MKTLNPRVMELLEQSKVIAIEKRKNWKDQDGPKDWRLESEHLKKTEAIQTELRTIPTYLIFDED